MAQNTRTAPRRGTHAGQAVASDSTGAKLLRRAERLWREKEGKSDDDMMVKDWARGDCEALMEHADSGAASLSAAKAALDAEKIAGSEGGPTLRAVYHDLIVSQMSLKAWNLLLIRRKRDWSEAYAAGTPKGSQEQYRGMQARIGECQSTMVATYQAAGRVSAGLDAENRLASQAFSVPMKEWMEEVE